MSKIKVVDEELEGLVEDIEADWVKLEDVNELYYVYSDLQQLKEEAEDSKFPYIVSKINDIQKLVDAKIEKLFVEKYKECQIKNKVI